MKKSQNRCLWNLTGVTMIALAPLPIWIFGIEPGDSIADKLARSNAGTNLNSYANQSYSIERQLKCRFNQKAFKLLAAIEGETDYKAFAMKK